MSANNNFLRQWFFDIIQMNHNCRFERAEIDDMRREFVYLILALYLPGCAPAALIPSEVATGLLQSVGSTATTLWTSPSLKQLNGANTQLAQAEAHLALYKAAESAVNDRRSARERMVTARLLKQMARTYHDPLLETLAEWVDGGGDPDFAFKYALVQINPSNSHIKVIPPEAGLETDHNRLVISNHIAHALRSNQPQLHS